MKRRIVSLLTALALTACAPETLDLGGSWRFAADPDDVGQDGQWYARRISGDTVTLPGSMLTNGKGDPITLDTPWTAGIWDSVYFKSPLFAPYREADNIKVPFFLQPETYYLGPAWYQREIRIPSSWAGRPLELCFERAHWECTVWIDGRPVGTRNALSAPDRYLLTDGLPAGRHVLTLRVDNRVRDIDPGDSAHSVSDHTQGNWNGVAGAMTLRVSDPAARLGTVRLFPDLETRTLRVEAEVAGTADEVVLRADLLGLDRSASAADGRVSLELPLPEEVQPWDEFHPNLYTVRLALEADGREVARRELRFGCRKWEARGAELYLNGHPAFLRGTVDCAAYPLTGFPPFDKQHWLEELRVVRSYGLNHVRFHSWCPPEAAFEAADELGMYLQVEASVWATLGDGAPVDRWLYEETERILDEYANHPSFCFFAHGNEPHGPRHPAFLTEFVRYWKQRDPRPFYTAGANWPNLPVNDYYNDAGPRIQAWEANLTSVINAREPSTDYDWSDYTSRWSDKPMVAHEIGQWCVYPDFKEMALYTGPLKPRNFEIFRETLEQNGMAELAEDFLMASGKLQNLCYKADIEAELRTPGVSGFQLLSLIDFPGQGSALTGALNVFYGQKGYASPEDYRQFCNALVPLARMSKLIYTADESFAAGIEAANFSRPLSAPDVRWRVVDAAGLAVREGRFSPETLPLGKALPLGDIRFDLSGLPAPAQYRLEVAVDDWNNGWNFWVYPPAAGPASPEVLLTDRLDDRALQALSGGGKVLLSLRQGSLAPEYGGDIALGFSSIFWNTSFTNGQAPHTLGILCDPDHPALRAFPTAYHSDYQWHDPVMHAGAIRLDRLNPELAPIVRVIDDWYTNRPLGLLLEAAVGGGKLLISGVDFHADMASRPAARQLLRSLLDYMESDAFRPSVPLETEQVRNLTSAAGYSERSTGRR